MTLSKDESVPVLGESAFDCPACGAYAHQPSYELLLGATKPDGGTDVETLEDGWDVTQCAACATPAIWHHGELLWPIPLRSPGPPPHEDMPPSVQKLYLEASAVAGASSRAAAALLRLALQVLVDDLAPGSGRIDDKIGRLVRSGLDPQVQKAMDVVRVVGNNAVHPGQIDLDSEADLIAALFGLINIIVEQMVARPKHIAELYGALPLDFRQLRSRWWWVHAA